SRIAPEVIEQLKALGHEVEILAPFTETMGHAAAAVRLSNGSFEGAFDPRSNGAAAGY
ncbi:gamma-glutamyltransferase, partial [Pseudomonas sp. DOAB1069]|nr:gamma-glutamyltransferase [Pseudomonas folii]